MVNRTKKAAAILMKDRCSVYEKRAVVKDGLTEFEEVLKYENVPCTISGKSYLFGERAANENKNLSEAGKKVRLFLPPEYEPEAGSRIEVTRLGRREIYKRSGQVKKYLSHNEVMIELMHDWA